MSKRIIPCLDIKRGELVKGIHFKNVKEVGDPVNFAEIYDEQGADEIIALDIASNPRDKPIFVKIIQKISDSISIPFIVGGGITDIEDALRLINAGADKVSIGTAAVKNPELLEKLSGEFGSERIVCALDAKKVDYDEWEVYISGGRKRTGINMIDWVREVESRGVGEILYTGLHTDGTQEGYDIEGTRKIIQVVNIPVIASGGAGNLKHIYEVFSKGKADAALAASIFHFGKYTVKEVKEYLREREINVRI